MANARTLLGVAVLALCISANARAADTTSRAPKEPHAAKKALKVKAPPPAEKPFFFIDDNRITFAQFLGAAPGFTSKTWLSTVAFTHFDAWAYGTNSFALVATQADHSAPTTPCAGPNTFATPVPVGQCAGAVLYTTSLRSTFGWNELFGTKAFSAGPLTNISFVAGGDAAISNLVSASGQYDVVAGLQFSFALPYKGFFNISPLYSQRWGYGANTYGPAISGPVLGAKPPFVGFPDGVFHFSPTWGLDLNYYMDLGFLPENMRYFSISGRASIRGADGTGGYGPYVRNPLSARTISYATEPVRVTFDAGKFFWGQRYTHLVDLWAAWRYDYNILGYNVASDPACLGVPGSSNNCVQNGVYYGMTVKLGQPGQPGTPSTPASPRTFFSSIDNTLSYGVLPNATSPSETAKTVKQVYSFTHNDSWAYGTNLIHAEVLKSDRTDPASPCTSFFNKPAFGVSGPCAGTFEVNAKLRSTLGFNELFGTTAFTAGPLRNVSFEFGGDGMVTQSYWGANKKAVVAGLQFAFDLPYKSYLNVAPLYYQEWNHSVYAYPNNAGNTPFGFLIYGVTGVMPAGFTGTIDGNLHYQPTWALELKYGSELAFLPPDMRYFSISGHVGIYGPKGTGAYGNFTLPPAWWNTKTEINAEPIRVSFDLSKALWGEKYSHFVEPFVAYRYWQNKYGLDSGNPANRFCFFADGTSNKSCTEQTVYAGITAKF